jgi:hypothetical protein
MPDTLFIRPVDGRRVRRHDQGFRPLALEGELVSWDANYQRLLEGGDIEVVPEPTAANDKQKGGDKQ